MRYIAYKIPSQSFDTRKLSAIRLKFLVSVPYSASSGSRTRTEKFPLATSVVALLRSLIG